MKVSQARANAYAEAPPVQFPHNSKPDSQNILSNMARAGAQLLPDPHQAVRDWFDMEELLRSHFVNPDIEAAKILFACAAAHKISNFQVAWLMLIGPPGSMKTVLLESMGLVSESIHYIDEVTANTFISGKLDDPFKPKRAPAGFLHRMGPEGIVINPDFGTIINMNRNVRASVLAQLRRIYDGHFSREFGTGENLDEHDWRGRMTLLAGATPDVDKHHSVFQALGERFLYVRLPRGGGVQA